MATTNTKQQEWVEVKAEVLERASVEHILSWAVEQFQDRITLACSCGPEDIVLLDHLVKIDPQPHVFFLDTDKHFAETYQIKRELEQKYDLTFHTARSPLTLEEQAEQYGERLWEHHPHLCCQIRKVEPLKDILRNFDAWITGIRRAQSPTRANAQAVELDDTFGLIKINPLIHWTKEEVWRYIDAHNIPYNPLHDQNYPSIGCDVCTRPVAPGEDERAGRWAGHLKTECGLHKGEEAHD